MDWVKGSDYHIVSACKLYKVSKCWVVDKFRYTAWRIENQWRAVDLVTTDDPQVAKDACDDDKGKKSD